MYSREFDANSDGWSANSTYSYNPNEHPQEFDFTFDEIIGIYHEAGSAGTAYSISVEKDLGNGRIRQFYGIHLHVSGWLKMAKREIDRARQGLPPTRYLAQRAKSIWWVNPKLCDPIIDSSKYPATQKINQKKMVA